MKKFYILFAGILVSIAILFSGCANSNNKATLQTHEVKDSTGKIVKIPLKPQRIVSLTLSTDEILIDLVEPSRIAALTYLASDAGISHIANRCIDIPKIRGTNPEAILALKPDLVLIADWWALDTLQTLRDLGLNVYVYKTPYTIEAVRETIKEVAAVVGEEKASEQVLEKFDSKLQAIQTKVATVPSSKYKKVITLTGRGGFGAKNSLYNDMCRYGKFTNSLAELPDNKANNLAKESIVQLNPDIILIPTWTAPGMPDNQTKQETLSDPALKTTTALKNKAIIEIPEKSVYCVSQYVLNSLDIIVDAVYPEYIQK